VQLSCCDFVCGSLNSDWARLVVTFCGSFAQQKSRLSSALASIISDVVVLSDTIDMLCFTVLSHESRVQHSTALDGSWLFVAESE